MEKIVEEFEPVDLPVLNPVKTGRMFMRRVVLCGAIVLMIPFMLSGQKQKVRISKENVTFQQIFDEIEQKTGYTIAYSSSSFDPSQKVSFWWRSGKMERVLARALRSTGFTFVIKNKHIIILSPERLAAIHEKWMNQEEEQSDTSIVRIQPTMSGMSDVAVAHKGLPSLSESSVTGTVVVNKTYNKPVKPVTEYKLAVKTNLLYLATATLNLGVEMKIAENWTLQGSLGYNPWSIYNTSLKHLSAGLEGRYWPKKVFSGHFIGFNGVYGNYDMKNVSFMMALKKHTVKGDLYGGGVSWGYSMPLRKRLNLEFTVGLGYARLVYDKYEYGREKERLTKNYFGPTKLGLNFTYYIK